MNRGRLLIIGVVALLLGAAVSSMVYRNLQAHAAPNGPPAEWVWMIAGPILSSSSAPRVLHSVCISSALVGAAFCPAAN